MNVCHPLPIDTALSSHDTDESTSALAIFCTAPGLGGSYRACGLCSSVYKYASCCTAANPYTCLDQFAKNEPDCREGQGYVSDINSLNGFASSTTPTTILTTANLFPTAASASPTALATPTALTTQAVPSTGSPISSPPISPTSTMQSVIAQPSSASPATTLAGTGASSTAQAAMTSRTAAANANAVNTVLGGVALLLIYLG